jgi:hypothetical protein
MNQFASPETSTPSHAPLESVQELMQQSTSPPQYGRSSYSHREFAARRSAVSPRTSGSRPHSRSDFRAQVVAVQGCPCSFICSNSKPLGKYAPPAH